MWLYRVLDVAILDFRWVILKSDYRVDFRT